MKHSAFAPTAFPPVDHAAVSTPLVWVLANEKVGDNAQALTLAAALGWRTEVKHLRFRTPRRRLAPSRTSVRFPLDVRASSALAPPWPDLVIACGRRSAAVALEIRSHAGPSTRLVQLGRPRTDLDAFDLVVTTPQYRLPRHARVLHLRLPMHRADGDARDRAAAEWRPRLAALPRPWIAVLLGGPTKPYVFSGEFARRTASQLNVLRRTEGASLLLTTSRRTPPEFTRALAAELAGPSFVHHWDAAPEPNPYQAYLALADAFVVTGDSASMLAEACGTGRRVWIADPPTTRPLPTRFLHRVGDLVLRATASLATAPVPVLRSLARAPAKGWLRRPRDMRRLHAALIAENRALPLGRPFTIPPPPTRDDIGRVAARVAALFERGGP